jgi:uncharacterized membrane protein (DUF4010 family)
MEIGLKPLPCLRTLDVHLPSMNIDVHIIVGITVALGCGLLVGIERERRKATGPHRALAGVRTFALAATAGAFAQALEQQWLVISGALLIISLAAIAYWRERSNDPGITTEMALFVTYMLGVAAIDYPALSAGTAVIVAGLLAARDTLHYFSRKILSESELRDGLLLAAAALVVLPLLPNQTTTWLAGANPRRLWGLVVLLMALQAGGYVALRLAGPRLGLALSGLASGFVSSTATIAAIGARARQDPSLRNACVSGALFSNIATFSQLFLVTTAIYPPGLILLAPCFLTGLLVAAMVASSSLLAHHEIPDSSHPAGRAFSLPQALGFAAILSGVTVAIAFANSRYGLAAVSIGSALAGLVDVHAAATSTLSLGASGALHPSDMLLPILIAFSTNTGSKLVSAFLMGGTAYALRVGAGLVVILIAVWAPYFLSQQ